MQVHEGPGVPLLPFLGVHEGLAEAHGVLHVVTAAAPVEGALGIPRGALLSGIAGAGVQLTLAAGPRQRVHHTGRGDGVHEGHLAAACRERGREVVNRETCIRKQEGNAEKNLIGTNYNGRIKS